MVEQTVQIIDVMPTLLEMSGLRVPAESAGPSLAAAARPATGVDAAGPAITEKTTRDETACRRATPSPCVVAEAGS